MIIIPFFLYEIDRRQVYSIFLAFIRKLLVITDTELKAIAAAAIIGFSKNRSKDIIHLQLKEFR